MRFEGKVLLVTGSATGVGEGIVRRAASEGASVVVHGLEVELGQRVAQEAGGIFVEGDLFDPTVPAKLVAAAVSRFGRLDGLVNNAAVSLRGGLDTPVDLYDRIMAINARAPFLLVQAAFSHLKESRGGIVNIGSVHANRGSASLLPYAMSKAALANMTKTLAEPLSADGIRINQLNLGWTLTPNEQVLVAEANGWEDDWPARMAEKMPFGRLLSPEDVAAATCLLLSPEGSMITGQVWGLDQRPH